MTDPLLFKKYSNRRLYSLSESKYVSLGDLAGLIKEGSDISVKDAKTDDDVTAFVLTQIVLEEARNKNALLPSPLLHIIIRYGDNILVDFFETHLRWIIERYMEFKQAADKQFLSWLDFGKNLTETARQGFRSMSPFGDFFGDSENTGANSKDPKQDS
jgi:polyhydroxyalkanoate synthesis repressor PhaR